MLIAALLTIALHTGDSLHGSIGQAPRLPITGWDTHYGDRADQFPAAEAFPLTRHFITKEH